MIWNVLGLLLKKLHVTFWRILKEKKINFSESSGSVISRSVLRMSVYSPHRGTFDCWIDISNWYFSSQKPFCLILKMYIVHFFQKEHLKICFRNVSYFQTQTLEHFNFSKLQYQCKDNKLELKDAFQILHALDKTFVHLYLFSICWKCHMERSLCISTGRWNRLEVGSNSKPKGFSVREKPQICFCPVVDIYTVD